ncbi:PAS domain-containing protein [Pontibacter oryzae]|uniref:histidine kinase n=1 Tax=Pontibacter oryzae TaxID=2304593 RepID=A0A399RSI5_9BACT|nr:PAS domain-containing protein [Pontibacter oryzae]RIJ34068.1 PAS domain S-box protein [Pontibacter oryzae]
MDLYKLFIHIPEPIVVISPEYKVLDATDKYLEVTMRTREELIGQDLLKAFPDNPNSAASKNVKTLRQSLDNALHTKQVDLFPVTRYDIPRPAAQGGGFDIRFWEASHTPVLDDAGNVMFIIQRTADVTEREIAKLVLSETEEKFRFMAEAMPQLINTSNAAGEYTYFNQRWVNYTGLSPKELLGGASLDAIHPDDLKIFLQRRKEAYENGSSLQVELRIREKDKAYRWHLTRGVPMQGEDGKVIMWVFSSTDIHDMRQMVHELLEANEQMEALSDQVQLAYKKVELERTTLERVFMQVPALLCILKGPDHRFELVNPAYQQMMPGKELVGKTVVEAMPEVVEQGFIEMLDAVYNSGKPIIVDEILVKLDRFGTGETSDIYVTLNYQPLINEKDQVTGIIFFGYDVTTYVEAKQKLQQLNDTAGAQQ